jgi:hypothetical protein
LRLKRSTLLFLTVLAVPLGARAEALRLRMIEPVQGATLAGGSTVVLQWSAAGLGDRSGIEEWEAFLSLDGGRYYSVRITPHLDLSVREFRWVVPNVDSADARILIRLGDERQERGFELPARMRIVSGARVTAPAAPASSPGEAARPGDPGVGEWVDGDRRGGGLATIATSIPSLERQRAFREEADLAGTLLRQSLVVDRGLPRRAIPAARRIPPRPALDVAAPNVLRETSRLNI